jgi:hypothetical protein
MRWLMLLVMHHDDTKLTPKGPMFIDGFLGSLGRLSRRQKHERRYEILKEGGPM